MKCTRNPPPGNRVSLFLQHNLLTFKIDEEDGISTFLFEGSDHREGGAANGKYADGVRR